MSLFIAFAMAFLLRTIFEFVCLVYVLEGPKVDGIFNRDKEHDILPSTSVLYSSLGVEL